jgi:hypothetical protein
MEIAAAVVGVLATAAVALLVYLYRGLITYKAISIDVDVKVDGSGKVYSSKEWDHIDLQVSRIWIANRVFTSIDDASIYLEGSYNVISAAVTSTTSLAKGQINVTHDVNAICINTSNFPRHEKIEVDLVLEKSYFSPHFPDFKGSGAKFRLVDDRRIEARNKGFRDGAEFMLSLIVSITGFYIYFNS